MEYSSGAGDMAINHIEGQDELLRHAARVAGGVEGGEGPFLNDLKALVGEPLGASAVQSPRKEGLQDHRVRPVQIKSLEQGRIVVHRPFAVLLRFRISATIALEIVLP